MHTNDSGWIADHLRDVRYGVRSLARSPAFAAMSIIVLALGIGAATAVFTIVEGVWLRPLPYPAADRLYALYEQSEAGGRRLVSHPTFRDWEAGARGLDGLAFIRGDGLGVRTEAGTRTSLVGYATESFFRTMATPPARGRVWSDDEAATGAPVAVLSWRAWREAFGGDPDIVGSDLSTEAGPITVIGVMPEGFAYPEWAELWMPALAIPAASRVVLDQRDLHVDSRVIARVAAGTDVQSAISSLAAVSTRLEQLYPDARGFSPEAVSVRAELLGGVGERLAMLVAAASMLLLLAFANVAGLFLARGAARGREIATRVALGAGRGRLVRLLLTEAGIVALLGGLAGSTLAAIIVRAVVVAAPAGLPRLDGIAVDLRVPAIALGLSLAAVLTFGLTPGLRAAKTSPMDLLRGARGAGAGRTRGLRSALVVAEVALAMTLTVSAILLIRTMAALDVVRLGFEPQHAVAVRVVPPSPRYDTPEAALALYRRLEEEARRLPGVESAAVVNHLPLSGTSMITTVTGGRELGPDESPLALYRTASADYARTLAIRMVSGRFFTEAEVAAGDPVALVNESLATRRWGDRNPVGETILVTRAANGRADFGEEVAVRIVGVISDTRHFGPAQDPVPTVYLPVSFDVWPNIFVVARATYEPAVVAERLRRALLEIDPLLPIAGPGFSARVRPMAQYEAQATRDRRLNAAVIGSFAAVAFVLATVGIVGVLAWLAIQRRREFGIRLSLGARPGDLAALVVRGGLRLVGLGLLIGIAGAAFATRLLRSALFGVEPLDWRSFLAAASLFLLAGVLACAVPALRAARLHPAAILREE